MIFLFLRHFDSERLIYYVHCIRIHNILVVVLNKPIPINDFLHFSGKWFSCCALEVYLLSLVPTDREIDIVLKGAYSYIAIVDVQYRQDVPFRKVGFS